MKTMDTSITVFAPFEPLKHDLESAYSRLPSSIKPVIHGLNRLLHQKLPESSSVNYHFYTANDIYDFLHSSTNEKIHTGDKFIVWSRAGEEQMIADFIVKASIRKLHEKLCILSWAPSEQRIAEIRRILMAATASDRSSRIIAAKAINLGNRDRTLLEVGSATLDQIRIPFIQIPPLRNAPAEAWTRFEIDADGSFIYWPDLDIHLGWEQLKQIADPDAARKVKQRSAAYNKRYGAAIRKLRQSRKLTQSAILGLSSRQVSRIESGHCRATHAALQLLAKAHGMECADYLEKLSELMPPQKA